MTEIWRDIEGYEGRYQVSSLGRVKSLNYCNTGNEGFLKPGKTGRDRDYFCVALSKDKKLKTYLVHRLVAQAFLPNPNDYPQVNHKDENKENNFVWVNEDGTVNLEKSNLEWCDNTYNSNYGTRNSRIRKIKSKKVYQYLDGEIVGIYDNALIPEKLFGYKHTHIYKSIKTGKKSYGFSWTR